MTGTIRWGRLIVLCILAAVIYFTAQNAIDRRKQEIADEEAVLRVQLSEMRDETASLQNAIANVGSESYIESRAREEYHFMKAGELRFEFSNPEALYEYSDEEKAALAAEQNR